MRVPHRLRNESRDLLELVLVPGLAAVLPWRFCFRLFRWISRRRWLYAAECDQALAHAVAYGWAGEDRARWIADCRLVTLIDNADFFLSRFRSDRWMDRYLVVEGKWPLAHEAAVCCTFHWGAGMWALRHLGARRVGAHALVAPHSKSNFPGRTVRWLYYGARNRENERAMGTAMIEAGSVPRTLLRVLKSGEQLIAAVDVPGDQAAASETIRILGHNASVPRGLFRIAAQSGAAVYVYLTGIRMSDGKRTLRIVRLSGADDDMKSLMGRAFALLEEAIVSHPPAWHFWKVAPRFFRGQPDG